MRIWISIISIIAISFAPVSVHANDFEFIPKPEWEVDGDRACMDFENTQNVVRMRAQYVTLFELVPTLRQEADTWQRMAETALEVADHREDAYNQLFTVYTETDQALDQAILDRNRAEKFAIYKSALPWIIAGAAVVFAGGIYVGAKFNE